MRANAGIFIIICLLFLVGTVGAVGIPDTISTPATDKSYVAAGSDDQATITAIVSNTTPGFAGFVTGAMVEFTVLDPSLGTFSPTTATTDENGKATSLFKPKTKSGFASIRANVTGTTIFQTTIQKIDHNKAYFAVFSHPLEGEVNTTVPLAISFTDYYGNPIDQIINTNQNHTISLHVYGPPPDDCNFVGYGHEILNQVLDPYGNVTVQVKLTSGVGPNSITMDQFELIPPPSQRIITAISSDVSSIKSSFNPQSPPGVPADGNSTFTITYNLYDKYRNPAGQQLVLVNTSFGENSTFKTDNLGQIVIEYGKKIDPGFITINATSATNRFVNISDTVEFTSIAATNMVLSANPEVMVSRDKKPSAQSNITATLTTIMGGVPEPQNVTFSLGTDQYPGGPYNVTNRSSLSPTSVVTTTSATTDENGDATVAFYPGSFSTNLSALHYSNAATGQVTVTATWNNNGTIVTKDILIKWKNYPYLSAKTSLNPDKIKVNDTVDVTILLTADGWALQPIPIDVILVMDRSTSMADSMSGHTKLYYAQNAAKTFVTQMDQSKDRIGVVSYAGYTSGTGTHTDISLSHSQTGVNTAINSLNANGATETREALKQSIDLMKANPNPDPNAKQAIILMTDGNFNWKGSPIAMGTAKDSSYNSYSTSNIETTNFLWYSGLGCSVGSNSCTLTNQNLSIYASNNNIRLYMISFTANPSDFDPKATSAMQIMANATGGFYAYAPDSATLNQIYTKIAGELKDTAGVNTTMTADFTNVNVTGVTLPGANVFDYVYHPPASTSITWWNLSTTIPTTIDQSAQWAANQKLNFTVGTMKVGDAWQTTFRLKAKQSGSIDLFGTNSFLTFNNSGSIETLTLPHTYLTVTPDLSNPFEQQQIDVMGFCAAPDPNTATMPISWITTYTGPETDVLDQVNYIDETGAHIPFYQGSYHVTNSTSTTRMTTFDLKTVPEGREYDIEVVAHTESATAQDTMIACTGVSYNSAGKTFIKLS